MVFLNGENMKKVLSIFCGLICVDMACGMMNASESVSTAREKSVDSVQTAYVNKIYDAVSKFDRLASFEDCEALIDAFHPAGDLFLKKCAQLGIVAIPEILNSLRELSGPEKLRLKQIKTKTKSMIGDLIKLGGTNCAETQGVIERAERVLGEIVGKKLDVSKLDLSKNKSLLSNLLIIKDGMESVNNCLDICKYFVSSNESLYCVRSANQERLRRLYQTGKLQKKKLGKLAKNLEKILALGEVLIPKLYETLSGVSKSQCEQKVNEIYMAVHAIGVSVNSSNYLQQLVILKDTLDSIFHIFPGEHNASPSILFSLVQLGMIGKHYRGLDSNVCVIRSEADSLIMKCLEFAKSDAETFEKLSIKAESNADDVRLGSTRNCLPADALEVSDSFREIKFAYLTHVVGEIGFPEGSAEEKLLLKYESIFEPLGKMCADAHKRYIAIRHTKCSICLEQLKALCFGEMWKVLSSRTAKDSEILKEYQKLRKVFYLIIESSKICDNSECKSMLEWLSYFMELFNKDESVSRDITAMKGRLESISTRCEGLLQAELDQQHQAFRDIVTCEQKIETVLKEGKSIDPNDLVAFTTSAAGASRLFDQYKDIFENSNLMLFKSGSAIQANYTKRLRAFQLFMNDAKERLCPVTKDMRMLDFIPKQEYLDQLKFINERLRNLPLHLHHQLDPIKRAFDQVEYVVDVIRSIFDLSPCYCGQKSSAFAAVSQLLSIARKFPDVMPLADAINVKWLQCLGQFVASIDGLSRPFIEEGKSDALNAFTIGQLREQYGQCVQYVQYYYDNIAISDDDPQILDDIRKEYVKVFEKFGEFKDILEASKEKISSYL